MDDFCWFGSEWLENLFVRESVGEACVVKAWATNPQRRSFLVLIVEDGFGEERPEEHDVLVRDVVGQACSMFMPSSIPDGSNTATRQRG